MEDFFNTYPNEEHGNIMDELEEITSGPAASAYLGEKDGQFTIYWKYSGVEDLEESGTYATRQEALDEVVNDFSNCDDLDEVVMFTTIYDEYVETKVNELLE